jgi:hypothetical protein
MSKEIKEKPRFTEIHCFINNMNTKTFSLIILKDIKDKLFLFEGKRFLIDYSSIEKVKYDIEMERLKGIAKLKRWIKPKRIGKCEYAIFNDRVICDKDKKPILDKDGNFQIEKDIEPIKPKNKIDIITEHIGDTKTNPTLLKAITESWQYKDAIRSIPGKLNLKGTKWIIVAGIIVVIVVIGLILTGVIKL